MNFASYTTSEYFPIFLTFYNSIKNNDSLNLHVLCLDHNVKGLLKEYKINCKAIELSEIENYSNKIQEKKYNNIAEKIGVYRLAYVDYLLNTKKQSFHLIDSDTYFFSKINDLNTEIKNLNASVAFCRHNFYYKKKEMCNYYGIYNAGYIYFNYDKTSLKFLSRYRNLCQEYISWKTKKYTKNTFADQTYLEQLMKEFKNIKIIENKGINCAPWNIGNYKLQAEQQLFKVDEYKLIFFHFSGIRSLFNKFFFFNLYHYNNKNLIDVKNLIYKIYLKNFKKNLTNFKYNKIKRKITLKSFINLVKKIFVKDFLII